MDIDKLVSHFSEFVAKALSVVFAVEEMFRRSTCDKHTLAVNCSKGQSIKCVMEFFGNVDPFPVFVTNLRSTHRERRTFDQNS